MKKLLTLLSIGAAVLVVSAVPGAAAPQPRTIDVHVAAGEPAYVDELEPGQGPGDWLLFHDPVLDSDGERIGTAITRVQIIAPAGEGDAAFILDCTIELDGGRLVFTGAERLSHLETGTSYALIGGTGSYAGTRGQVTGTPATMDGKPTIHLTFELVKK